MKVLQKLPSVNAAALEVLKCLDAEASEDSGSLKFRDDAEMVLAVV
jgi:hypothetical protein